MAKDKSKSGFWADFKAFISKGNVLDMAVGVIIATAFGKITTSLINDVLMPLIGMLVGGIDLAKLNIVLKEAVVDGAGEVVSEAVVVGLGTLITAIIDFLLVAFVVFLLIRGIAKAQKRAKKEEEEAPAEPEPEPEPTKEELLLTEIRDLLKDRK